MPIFFKKGLLTILVLASCYASVEAGRRFLPKSQAPQADPKLIARSMGNPKSDLWITEYMDFQCGNCRMASRAMEKLFKEHPNKIYLQVRYYPLMHAHLYALKSAIYAECASKQGKFWPLYKTLLEDQEVWANAQDVDGYLHSLTAKAGVDAKALDVCVEDPATKESILREREDAVLLGVNTTPTFFVNGKKLIGVSAFLSEIDFYFSGEGKK